MTVEISRDVLDKIEALKKKSQDEQEKIQKLFNIDDFQINPDKTEEVYVKGLGLIKYKQLTIADLFGFPEVNSKHEYTARLIWMMMSKADQTVTFEKIRNLPPDVASLIFDVLSAKIVFLPPEESETLKSGLTKVQKRRTSG